MEKIIIHEDKTNTDICVHIYATHLTLQEKCDLAILAANVCLPTFVREPS